MIRVEIEISATPGWYKWRFGAAGSVYRGESGSPLLDACRAAKQAGADTRHEIGLFREGRTDFDIKTNVGYGARLRVKEEPSPHFVKWDDVGARLRS